MPIRLLEGELPDIPRDELAALLETELLRLGACEARLDLELGRALRSCVHATVQELGFSGLESYCPEALGFARRVASELMTLDQRLAMLPWLREAYLAGALPRSRVRIACSVATPETDLRWMLACLRSSTRALQAMAKSERQRARVSKTEGREDPASQHMPEPDSGAQPDSDADEEMTRVRLHLSADDLAHVEHVGIPMLQAVVGASGPRHVLFEALAADMLAELGPEIETPGVAPAPGLERGHGDRDSNARPAARLPKAGGACEPESKSKSESESRKAREARHARRTLHRWRTRLGGVPAVAWPVTPEQMTSPHEIHARLRQLSAWRHGLAWQRGRLLALLQDRRLWGERRHATFHEWHERRLGLSPKETMGLISLSKKTSGLPVIDSAWREGRLDATSAHLLSQVAEPETESDWLRLAQEASGKRLEMEVAAQLAARSRLGWSRAHELTGGRPQWKKPMSELHSQWDDEMERRLRARRAREAAHPATKASAAKKPAPDSPYDLDGSLSDRGACERDLLAGPSLGRKRRLLAFDAPVAVAKLLLEALRQVARATGWTLDTGGCLLVMLHRFAETHVIEGLADRSLRARVLRRDGWRCFMPRCRSRKHLDVHHVIFRSHGGSDAMWNLVALCHPCHRLLHEGKLRLTGEAPSGLLVRMGRVMPSRLAEWFREGIRRATGDLAA